ncbi:MAG: XRE family transcriptional regulator, partial [Oscillospiraceae bacterium]|nr:XRE family transcriptional regulator [Oscillospiraceae bacterium]
SGDELLSVAEADSRQKENRIRDIVFAMLDLSTALLFFLPFFADKTDGAVQTASLLGLVYIAPYLKTAYFAAVAAVILCGILTIVLQNCTDSFWLKNKSKISVLLTTALTLLFIISQQPYAAVFLFVFLAIKVLMLVKWQ